MIISSFMLRGVGEGRNQNVQYGQTKSTYEAQPVICVIQINPHISGKGEGERRTYIYIPSPGLHCA
jgi:hypothetical protein